MPAVLGTMTDLAYRFGLGPRPSDTPDHGLVELVEGPHALTPSRALDLGCGTGRNAIYLARHGWDTTGVDVSDQALRVVKRKAAEASINVRLVAGDVTRLADLDIGTGYHLLIDGGCYHMVPSSRRHAYAAGVTEVAASGALLVMVGFGPHLGLGMSGDELRARFPGWHLLAQDGVPGEHMCQYVSGPAPLRALLRHGAFHPMRYQLRRT